MAPRFAIVPACWLAADSGLNPSERLTLCILCIWVNRETEQCFPSIATIAAHAALSETTVRGAIRKLVAIGALEVQRRRDAQGDSDTNLYTVLGYDRPVKGSKGGTSPVAVPPASPEVPVPRLAGDRTATEPSEVPQPPHPNVVKDNKSVNSPARAAAGPEGPPSSRVALGGPVEEIGDWRAALAAAGVPERHLTAGGKFS